MDLRVIGGEPEDERVRGACLCEPSAPIEFGGTGSVGENWESTAVPEIP